MDKSVLLDRVMGLIQQVGTDIDWLFEVYTNRKFSLPDIVKRRFTLFQDSVKDVCRGDITAEVGNSYVNLMYGDFVGMLMFGGIDNKV